MVKYLTMHNHKKTKVLILLKQKGGYGYSTSPKSSGLYNSAHFLQEALIKELHIDTLLEIAVDGNDIDRRIAKHKPTHCILEALWVTPEKINELTKLHPKVLFIIRIHSKIPFLANEGIAITWIKEYQKLNKPNLLISFNNKETSKDFEDIGIYNSYLPNIYVNENLKNKFSSRECFINEQLMKLKMIKEEKFDRNVINIGCFGAIRPLKNQLLQAFAAIEFANKHNKILHFHINVSRVEQKGEEVLKNIRALFKDSKHILKEHGWLDHDDFLKLIKKMDVGLQMSFTESFNIVSADFIIEEIPIVVSDDINWIHPISRTDCNHVDRIIRTIEYVLFFKKQVTKLNLKSLSEYNEKAIKEWKYFFHNC